MRGKQLDLLNAKRRPVGIEDERKIIISHDFQSENLFVEVARSSSVASCKNAITFCASSMFVSEFRAYTGLGRLSFGRRPAVHGRSRRRRRCAVKKSARQGRGKVETAQIMPSDEVCGLGQRAVLEPHPADYALE